MTKAWSRAPALAASGAWLVACVCVGAAPAVQDGAAPTFKPVPAPAQPVAYSHRAHLAQGMVCVDCHATAASDVAATLPPTATCMSCHANAGPMSGEVQKLAAYDSRKVTVPWVRVYRVPGYVYFSHAAHMAPAAKLGCETCHGDVSAMDAMQKVKDTSMAACIECHRERAAPNRCDSCHDAM